MTPPSASTDPDEHDAKGEARMPAPIRWRVLALPALMMAWLLCHPYFGNNRGSLIYTARALADLDPSGIGQDAMFRLDGQSGFTIFTPLLRWLTASFGSSASSMGVALAATFAFFAAAATLAWQMAEGRLRYVIVIFMAALPSYYGGYHIFNYAEAGATPRPFAEALVIFALAALIGRRTITAILCIALATVIHPIMALPGVAVVLIYLGLEDRRWLILPAVLAALSGVAALAGVPPFDRIGTIIDPEWRTILLERNPHLFPSHWMSGAVGRKATELTALIMAASVVGPRLRNLFLTVAAVGVLGLTTAWLLGERLSLLLVMQAQTWRMMWLVVAVGAAALAVCAVELWRRDDLSRLSLLFLALAVAFSGSDVTASVFAATALALRFGLPPEYARLSRRGFAVAFTIVFAFVLITLIRSQIDAYTFLDHVPSNIVDELRRTLTITYDFAPLALGAAVWALMPRRFSAPFAVAAVCVVALLFAVSPWDRRSKEGRFLDESGVLPDLQQLVASKPGEIYWINGVRETWSWLGRPNWISPIQGASIVFSRELALRYRERAKRLIDLRLADDELVTPLTEPHLREIPPLTADRVQTFCAAPDAPAWIIAPLVKEEHLDPAIDAREWRAPIDKIEILDRNGKIGWRSYNRYAVIPCAK